MIYLIIDRPAGFPVHNVLPVFARSVYSLILNQLIASSDLYEYPVIILTHP